MGELMTVVSPNLVGKDPNDARDVKDYRSRVEEVIKREGTPPKLGLTQINDERSRIVFDQLNETDTSHDALSRELGRAWFHENARYVNSWSAWLLWDGARWLVDDRMKHMSVIGEYLKRKADGLMQDREAKLLKSAPFRHSVETIIKTDQLCSVLPTIFDNDTNVIGTPNGMILLETGEFVEPNRSNLITKATNVCPENNPPIIWLGFLKRIFADDEELIGFIKRLCGYALTGQTCEERLFFCYGTGANGKSKFLETLFYIFGDYARRAPSTLFLESRNEQHPTSMAGLQGARLVLGSELPSSKTWNEETLKDLTGGDTITARRMRQDFFDFIPQFTLMIAGNHQPRLKNVDESMTRRITLIPFNITIPKEERDQKLGEKLKAEAGAILNWCAEGAVEYFDKGLAIPNSILQASKEYIENEDITGEFIQLFLENSGDREKFDDVYKAYREWMADAGNNHIKRDRAFKKELVERGFDIKRSNSLYWVSDYSLKTSMTSYQKGKHGEF